MKTVKVICPCSAHVGTHHYPDKPNEFVEVVGCCPECLASHGDYSKSSNWKNTPPPDIHRAQTEKLGHWMDEPEPDKRGHGKRKR